MLAKVREYLLLSRGKHWQLFELWLPLSVGSGWLLGFRWSTVAKFIIIQPLLIVPCPSCPCVDKRFAISLHQIHKHRCRNLILEKDFPGKVAEFGAQIEWKQPEGRQPTAGCMTSRRFMIGLNLGSSVAHWIRTCSSMFKLLREWFIPTFPAFFMCEQSLALMSFGVFVLTCCTSVSSSTLGLVSTPEEQLFGTKFLNEFSPK